MNEWRIITARYANKCVECQDKVPVGTKCFWQKGTGLRHENCSPSLNDNCYRCGRLFSDKGGRARRLDPSKYRDTPSSSSQYCVACYYQYNAGFSGRDWEN